MAASKDDSFRVDKFGGALPAWDPYLLPDGQAASSTNGYLFSGGLEGWRVPKLLRNTTLSNPGFIYRVPNESSAIASAALQFTANPNAGDTVTVGEETYTFTATVTAAYQILIGGSAGATATNLFAALTYDNGSGANKGVLYGVGTTANPAIDQTSPQTKNVLQTNTTPPAITVYASAAGAAYNATAVAANAGARLGWVFNGAATTTLLGGQNLSIATDITGASTFMEFTEPNTDVIRSPLVDDQYERFYIASASVAPEYNTRARIQAGLASWLLGVPPPGCTPGVAVSGGGSSAQLGFPTAGTLTAATPGANKIYLVPVTPAGAMMLNDVSAMAALTGQTGNFVALLYNDVNGSPHSLLNVGLPVSFNTTAGQAVTSSFVNPTGLLMNVQYWLGFACDAALDLIVADSGAKGVTSNNTYSNGPPQTLTNLAVSVADLQVWGDLTTSSVLEARSYVYTYVTAYGEESAPSPPTTAIGWSNATWTVSLFQPPADQLGGVRNITKLRLYRSITAQSGATTYYQVTGTDGTDLPVTTAQYLDAIDDSVIVSNNQLQSQLWTPPPEDLQGLVVMPNGVLAGWRANEIWFCEPYRPHAWPPSYVQTTEYPIVGLGVTGNSLVAATSGAPYITTGVSPAAMTATKIQKSEPCHSRKSIIGNNEGVYYASKNGLILVSQYGQVTNVTESWITREKWQQLTPQTSLIAIFLGSCYFAYQVGPNGNEGGLGTRGFTIELNAADADSFSIWPQPGRHRLGFQLLQNPLVDPLAMVVVDPWSAVATFIARSGLYYMDFTDPAPTLSVADWSSKWYKQRTKKNFEVMRFTFTVPPSTPALNATRATTAVADQFWTNGLPNDRWGFVLVYAGNPPALVTARELRVNKELLRINCGFKHETWQFRVITRLHVSSFEVGTTVKGMANV